MTATSNTTGEAFALDLLRDDPTIDYADAQRAAFEAGLTLQPIQFGRARRQLGLTGVAPVAAPTAPPAAVATSAADDAAVDDDADDDIAIAGDEQPAPEPTPSKSERKGGSPAFEWLVESLRQEQTLSYGELKQRGEPLGHAIAPIMYGRAKALLGLVPVRPRGEGKNKKAKAVTAAPTTEAEPAIAAPRRSLAQVGSSQGSSHDAISRQLDDVKNIDQLVQVVRQLDAERRRLRTLLEQIANTIDEALGYAD